MQTSASTNNKRACLVKVAKLTYKILNFCALSRTGETLIQKFQSGKNFNKNNFMDEKTKYSLRQKQNIKCKDGNTIISVSIIICFGLFIYAKVDNTTMSNNKNNKNLWKLNMAVFLHLI